MHVLHSDGLPFAGVATMGLHRRRLGSSGSQHDTMADRGVPSSLLHAISASGCGTHLLWKAPWTFRPPLIMPRQAPSVSYVLLSHDCDLGLVGTTPASVGTIAPPSLMPASVLGSVLSQA